MAFDPWLAAAWQRHAEDPAGVAADLGSGAALVRAGAELGRIANLAHHVLGEHLARWDDATTLIAGWRGHPASDADADATLRVYLASLALCEGRPDADATLDAGARVRAGALAAAALAPHDAGRAAGLFSAALAAAEPLPAAGAHLRALAVSANNLACTLEEKPARSAVERDLMITAAQAGRRYWALAGGWLETERAEYRLARSWLQAGDARQARHHAGQCLEIVEAHGAPPLERFFAFEAIALAEHAAGDSAACRQAVAGARAAHALLDPADRAGCSATLDALGRLGAATAAR